MVFLFFWSLSVRASEDSLSSNDGYELELLTENKDLQAKGGSELEFKFKKKRNFFGEIGAFARSFFVDEYSGLVIKPQVGILNSKGVPQEGSAENLKVSYEKGGKFKVNLKKSRKFTPGKYRINLDISGEGIDGSEAVDFSQDFTWGVLAFNANKTQYLPGETAYLQMAALDDDGNTLCDADLILEISNPIFGSKTLRTADGTLTKNKECGPNNVINTPDYYAYYSLSRVGTYRVKLTAITANGTREITDSMEVRKKLPFEIERISPTRIYPVAIYENKSIIKANEDFNGEISDVVPNGFKVSGISYRLAGKEIGLDSEIVDGTGESRIVTKNVSLHRGDILEISYEFDSPNISPEFYLLGPLELQSGADVIYREARPWQIASDAANEIGHAFFNYGAAINYTPSAGVWQRISQYQIASTSFIAGHKYLVAINFAIINNSLNANSMAHVLHGSTAFADSEWRWETADTTATDNGHGFTYFTVWTAVAGENIEVEVTNASAATVSTKGYEAFIIDLSDGGLVENQDWYLGSATNSGNLPSGATWTTNGASVTMDGKGHNWMMVGSGYFLSDSTTADFRMRLYNSTDAVAYNQVTYEAEDTADNRPVTIMSGMNFTGTKTWRVDAQADTATTHDWTDSKIFALDLDKFQTSSVKYDSTTSNALNLLNSWINVDAMTHQVITAGDNLIWSEQVFDVALNSHRVYSRLTQDGTVVPSGYDSIKRDLSHGATDEDPHHLFYLGSMVSGVREFAVDMSENSTITTPGSVDIHNLVGFSMAMKTPPTSVFNLASQKSDGSGSVDISAEVDDADWQSVRLKVEYSTSSSCVFSPSRDPSLDTADANTTADYGDPLIDNLASYQVGTSTGLIITASGSNSVDFDWLSRTDLPSANGETYCLRLTANDFMFDQATSATTTVIVDNTAPSISAVSFPNQAYKIGDTLRATVTVSADAAVFSLATSTINNATTTNIQKVNNTTYTIDYIVAQGDTDRAVGSIPYSIRFKDAFGNVSTAYAGTSANGSIDANPPQITQVTAPDLMYKIGDTLRATVTVLADAAVYNLSPSARINGATTTNIQKISNTTYTIDYIVAQGDTDRHASGSIPVSIILIDSSDNENAPFTTLVSDASLDANPPVISSVYINNANYKIGDNATSSINADSAGYALSSGSTMNGVAVPLGNLIDNGGGSYTIYSAISEGDTDRLPNTIPMSIILRDAYGNANSAYTAVESNTATIDAHRPQIATISLPDRVYRIGDIVRATTTVGFDLFDPVYTLGTTTINGVTASNLQKVDGSTYTFDIIVSEGDSDRAAGTIPASLMLVDQRGQYNSPASTSVQANTASIDAHKPVISGVSFLPSSGVLKIGDTATATITADGANYTAGAMMINGVNVVSSFANLGSNLYRLVYTVAENDTDILDANGLPVSFVLVDVSGNSSLTHTSDDAANRPGVDAHKPIITDVSFAPASGVLKIGDTATATITADGDAYSAGVMTVNGRDVAAAFANLGGGQYRVAYTVQENDADVLDASDLAVSFSLIDVANNLSSAYVAADAGNRPGVDAHKPVISNVSFSPTSGVLKVGDTATVTITADASTYAAGAMTVNGKDVAATFANLGGNQYRAVYTVQEGDNDILDANNLPISFALNDAAGNASLAYVAADAANRPGVDAHRPVVTGVAFLPTSGNMKIGDTATATITADGTNYSAGTMTVNSKSVAATFVSLGGNQYRISYTVQEGDNDVLDAEGLPISFVLNDSAGNSSLAFTTEDPNNRPGVDAHRPVIVDVSFAPASGVLKIGDTATATITTDGVDYAAGAMTVNGRDVTATFSLVAGNLYQVSYTVQEGDADILDAADLPVSFVVRDTADNPSSAYSDEDQDNRPGVDAHKPVISGVSFIPASGVLKIGDIATATIIADADGYAAGSMMINGRDVSASFINLGGNQYQVAYVVIENDADIQDSANLPISIAMIDQADNVSLSYEVQDAGSRPGVDAHKPTIPGNLAFHSHDNASITLLFGATTTESNFREYKIFYKQGTSGATESDFVFSSSSDASLGNIDFNGKATTTISGLSQGTDYVFNIWAYDQAGNKANATEITASTNHIPETPSLLDQKRTDGNGIANGSWLNEKTAYFSATSSDADEDDLTLYYQLIGAADSYRTATTVPVGACDSGESYGDCSSNIWKTGSRTDWYDQSWLYRKQIKLDGGQIFSTESNFTLLVSTIDDRLKSASFGGMVGSSTGADILFTDSDGVTPLSYERERYSSSTGELIAWVKADLTAYENKVLYVYYGNANVTSDQASGTQAWDPNFVTVQHLADESNTTSKDSTKNGYTCTKSSAGNPAEIEGKIGEAQNFTGDTMSCGNFGSFSSYTAEAWIKASTTSVGTGDASTFGRTIMASALNAAGYPLWLATRGTEVRHWAYTNNSTGYYSTNGANLNTADNFHVVAQASMSGSAKIFVNGILMATSTAGNVPWTSIFTLGDLRPTRLIYFDGMVDEVRISSTTRSSGWIRTSYNNQNDPASFMSFSLEEESAASPENVLVSGLPDSASGYKWQVISCDENDACSEWSDFDPSQPNFKVDATAPSVPGKLIFNSKDSTYITFNFGSSSTETNFDRYRIFYKIGTNGASVSDLEFADMNLGYQDYNGAPTTSVMNLTANTPYVFNIWAYDQAGNKTAAIEYATSTKIASNPPVGVFNSIGQKTDGSGRIDISIEADDVDNNDTLSAKIEYSAGASCDFAAPLDPTIDSASTSISADYGEVIVDNESAYQVGSSSGWIMTSPGSNTVNFDWLSREDIGATSGVYCLRLTVNDDGLDQLAKATATVYIDNIPPTAPGQLALGRKQTESLTLDFGATTSDENFDRYRIFYKAGASGATELDSEHTDDALLDIDYGGKATTTVGSLSAGTQYVFNIWAYDVFGNAASSTENAFITNYVPANFSNLRQYRQNGATMIGNGGWTPEDSAKLRASINDFDTSEVVSIYFEFIEESAAFTSTTTEPQESCASSTAFGSCASKIWKAVSAAGDYSADPFIGEVAPTSVPDSSAGYKWQAMACDDDGACSGWSLYNIIAPNLKVDHTAPSGLGDLSVLSRTAQSLVLSFGNPATEANFSEYKIFYKEGASGVSEADLLLGSSTDADLASRTFGGATTTVIAGLEENRQYVFNIWAYDMAGNKMQAEEASYFTNARPSGRIDSVSEKTDAGGKVDISISVNDLNMALSRAKIEYVAGTSCDFSVPFDPTLDEDDASATSTSGDAKIANADPYQIGNGGGWITTDSGTNTVNFDWLAAADLPAVEGWYCLRLTANDGTDDQLVSATSTLLLDTKNPSAPGDLSLAARTKNSLTLSFGATSSDSSFARYRIFYREGAGTVTEGDTEKADANLAFIDHNGATTTVINGLLANTQYSFKIFAYDLYGNKAASGQSIFTTNAPPTASFNSVGQKVNGSGAVDLSLEVYDANGDECVALLEFASGASCDFSSAAKIHVDTEAASIAADYGMPSIDNAAVRQVGTTSGRIITSSGSNTLNIDWLSKSDIPLANGDYCLRLTAFDGADDQDSPATTTISIDNLPPTVPGGLSAVSVSGISATLGFSATSSDANFKEYAIYYKAGASGVTENDLILSKNDDYRLGSADLSGATTTIISGLFGSTQYVFNLWAYDLFGNRSSSTIELSTSTTEILSATWREAEDVVDPTAGVYLGRSENVRLRLAIANAGDWNAEDFEYAIEYGEKSGTCDAVASWQPLPENSSAEHFEMASTLYYDDGDLTGQRLANPVTDGYSYEGGRLVESPSNKSSAMTIPGNKFAEVEFNFLANANSVSGRTYCFRATDNGEVLDTYDRYPELTMAPPPQATFNSASQRGDGSGVVDISIEAVDAGKEDSMVRIDYVAGADCDFAAPADPTLEEYSESVSADFGAPIVENDNIFQIGTTSGYILTKYGPNTVNFDWNASVDLPTADGTYCLRASMNDGYEDQTVPATSTVIIDNVAPSAPGNLFEVDKSVNSVTLGLGSSSADSHFKEYKVFYKEGSSGVTESDWIHASNSDIHLASVDFGGATTTKISGLQVNKQYVFRIWAYDQFGNKSSSAGEATVIIRYGAKSENWRWYSYQHVETPSSPLSGENITPNNVANGSILKLRLALREIEGVTGEDVKLNLQYSTYSDFSADVNMIGEIGSSTLWSYADGIDADDDPIQNNVLSGVSSKAVHNESGISTSTFDHQSDSLAEWEFTIRANSVATATVYYFRAYNVTGGEALSASNGFNYPSLIVSTANITFSIGGFSVGSTTEGVVSDIETTPHSISFGDLPLNDSVVGVHRFNVSTNADGGYQLLANYTQNMVSDNGAEILPVSWTNDAPAAWPANPNPSAFGYHAGDDTLSGSSPSRFAPDNTYARLEDSLREVSFSEVPVENESVDMVYRIQVGDLQAAGSYQTEIIYILVPTFFE